MRVPFCFRGFSLLPFRTDELIEDDSCTQALARRMLYFSTLTVL